MSSTPTSGEKLVAKKKKKKKTRKIFKQIRFNLLVYEQEIFKEFFDQFFFHTLIKMDQSKYRMQWSIFFQAKIKIVYVCNDLFSSYKSHAY